MQNIADVCLSAEVKDRAAPRRGAEAPELRRREPRSMRSMPKSYIMCIHYTSLSLSLYIYIYIYANIRDRCIHVSYIYIYIERERGRERERERDHANLQQVVLVLVQR